MVAGFAEMIEREETLVAEEGFGPMIREGWIPNPRENCPPIIRGERM
jgi:hypothetical protein